MHSAICPTLMGLAINQNILENSSRHPRSATGPQPPHPKEEVTVATKEICPACRHYFARARLVLAWAAALPGVAGIVLAGATVVDAVKH